MVVQFLKNQISLIRPPLKDPTMATRIAAVVLFVFPALVLSAVLLQPLAEPKWMFLDTLAAAELAPDCCHVSYGMVSNVGILLWAGTAAICLLTGLLFLNVAEAAELRRFALSAGSLTAWVAVDDLFLMHERILPALGVPQPLVIAFYMVLALLYVLTSWRFILRHEWWMLAFGCAALAVSVFVDLVFHSLSPQLVYIEDSAKFIGITSWSLFHCLTIFNVLQERLIGNTPAAKA